MKHYLNKQDIIKYLDDITNIKSDKYYVNMMISWAIAESLYINFDQTIEFIEAKNLNRFVQNKAIQKAIESRKIKEDKKEYLRTLKI